MNDAESPEPRVKRSPAITHARIGPIIPTQATAFRYVAAIGVVLVIFALRAALAPLLGLQAPLLPFLLGVMIAAYLGGRGPAILASALTPFLATIWFTSWPHDAPPFQWMAHVAFFLLLAVLTAFIMHALQEAVLRADENAIRAEASAQALRENDRRKDEFLAMLAHELRNPLTPVRNVAYILGRKPGDVANVRRASEMLDRQASHLTRLVDDLLDVARITHRRVDLKREILNLEHVVDLALETVQPTIESRRQLVTTTITASQVYVDGDVVRLCQVVSNLLTNASKYSAEGQRILVNVEGNETKAIISVRDHGQGIDAQIKPHLFELFMQGDRSLDRAQGGLGVGLTIVKHLVEMHGGTVEALSEGVGKGSEFRVSLPRATGYPTPPASASSPQRRARRRRVLVVDDDVDNGESLRDVLRMGGHDVVVSRDGPAALAALDYFAADIVLLDVGLPRMDGFMVAHAIRARYGVKPCPRIIALTGYARAEDRQYAIRSGFDDHLTKPVEPERLLRVVADEGVTVAAPEGSG
ncbi:MAG TPA: hybrid sensor histidine kinase/response regulator [Steroidobacteraceae bacterium]|nr:hybrid sensor histidine kinase/response regulator [Steroidobacteraceae bacterium]